MTSNCACGAPLLPHAGRGRPRVRCLTCACIGARNAAHCVGCGDPLSPYAGRGKPRIRCEVCAADRSALGKAWRASHPREVAVYNRSRLMPWPSSPWVTDGRLHRPSKYLSDSQRGVS
jgi:hypothetical protein